ncbi:hypothetical protein BsIDN1_46400 [Bacillus safensis]|uniref:Uncharacterized protein n=1 Tax=Bacillus safensis TaxID=561879 RepID=A0A5S9MEI5_BACIA|nr:hypothetical protein BsIDN1_46400 [Bacillus safensis]
MSRNRLDDFFFGPRRGNQGGDETVVFPTRQIVNTRTNEQTIRKIHPTHITNVNKKTSKESKTTIRSLNRLTTSIL